MFTGIIEAIATLLHIEQEGSNTHFTFSKPETWNLSIDESVAHNGVCLTVVELTETSYKVTAVAETLLKTNLGQWQQSDIVNLERAMIVGSRLDGHIVQGHVDCVGSIAEIHDLDGSWMIFVNHAPEAGLTVTKGSVCLNGVSLTVVDSFPDAFSVAIIPYTWEHTNLSKLSLGDSVNIEFDILGKYMKKLSVSLPLIK
jgi:riboflavin synthase